MLALTYLLCSLTPTITVAMSPASPFAHCMTGDIPVSHHMHMTQQTADASSATHDISHQSHKPSRGQCCGVMCLPALLASFVEIIKPETPKSLCDASPIHAVAGATPPPRYRPPIA